MYMYIGRRGPREWCISILSLAGLLGRLELEAWSLAWSLEVDKLVYQNMEQQSREKFVVIILMSSSHNDFQSNMTFVRDTKSYAYICFSTCAGQGPN
jgi:hypothetical protein